LEHTPATSTRRFFNQLFGGSDPAAVLGDMVAPLLNNSMYTWKAAGPHVLIERLLIDRMASFAGFKDGEGIVTPGGSLSNLTAMVLARNRALPESRETSSHRNARVYSSAESHYSISKAAGMIGVGRSNVVFIKTDGQGRMDPARLKEAIQQDLSRGDVPIMINATAGTTVLGAYDPLDAIADIAEEYGIWLHVDGAYGGSLLLSPKYRHLLAGIERVDSLTWDAHKMMGVPLTCSVLLVQQKGALVRSMNEAPTYLFQTESDPYNPGVQSIQCGRRNDALKLWTAWRYHGDLGYAARINKIMDLVAHAKHIVAQDPTLELHSSSESLNICFTVNGVKSEAICVALHERGLALVGHGQVRGQTTIRLVCIDPEMNEADINTFFEDVRAVVASLSG